MAEMTYEGRSRERDMLLLSQAFYDNLERERDCEYGGWGLNDKRPFGNSDVEEDILEIIGDTGDDPDDLDELRQYAASLYNALGPFLAEQWDVYKTACFAKGF